MVNDKNMKISIDFFKDTLIEAIDAGIYEISICKEKQYKTLYIGESVFVLVRCATHLYKLKKCPEYFGFTEDTISDSNITLKFNLIEKINNKSLRKKREKELIKEKKPLSQSEVSDFQKNVEEKISSLKEFLDNIK